MLHRRFTKNIHGRDFVIGDIHGNFWKVDQALREVSFDTSKDRLFAVGDLIDRGQENELVLDWLNKPFFNSVIGNHEQLLILYYEDKDRVPLKTMIHNGAAWFAFLPRSEQAVFVDYFNTLPLTIDVELLSGEIAGIVHASCPYDNWSTFISQIESSSLTNKLTNKALWHSNINDNLNNKIITGAKHIFVGHEPIDLPHDFRKYGNIVYTDNFGWMGQRPFILYDANSGVALYDND